MVLIIGHWKVIQKKVNSANFSPDGGYIVSASSDCTIKIWDPNTHTQQSNKRKVQEIYAVAISPDGTSTASALANHTLELWSVITGKFSKKLKGHSDKVHSIMFSQNASQLVSGSADNSVRLWDTDRGTCLCIINNHLDSVQSVKFLSQGLQVVSGSFDKTVQITNLTGLHIHMFEGHSGKVYDIAVSSNEVFVASASQDTNICIWNVLNKKLMHTLQGHTKTVYTVAFSPNDTIIAFGSWDQTIQIWDIITGENLNVLQRDYAELKNHKVNFSYDQRFLIVGPSCIGTALEPYSHNTHDPGYNVNFQYFPAFYMRDGWITSVANQCRICWIPQVYHGQLVSTLNRVVLATPVGKMIILDLTKLNSHIENYKQ